jgi:hypothetical protein
VIVANKSDLPARRDRGDAIAVSALTGIGLDELRRAIVKALDIELMADRPDITNIRTSPWSSAPTNRSPARGRRHLRTGGRCRKNSFWRIFRTRVSRSKR